MRRLTLALELDRGRRAVGDTAEHLTRLAIEDLHARGEGEVRVRVLEPGHPSPNPSLKPKPSPTLILTCTPEVGRVMGAYGGGEAGGVAGGVSGGGGVDGRGGGEGSGAHCSQRQSAVHFSAQGGGMDGGGGGGEGGGGGGGGGGGDLVHDLVGVHARVGRDRRAEAARPVRVGLVAVAEHEDVRAPRAERVLVDGARLEQHLRPSAGGRDGTWHALRLRRRREKS